jgi:hypothetical protein
MEKRCMPRSLERFRLTYRHRHHRKGRQFLEEIAARHFPFWKEQNRKRCSQQRSPESLTWVEATTFRADPAALEA